MGLDLAATHQRCNQPQHLPYGSPRRRTSCPFKPHLQMPVLLLVTVYPLGKPAWRNAYPPRRSISVQLWLDPTFGLKNGSLDCW